MLKMWGTTLFDKTKTSLLLTAEIFNMEMDNGQTIYRSKIQTFDLPRKPNLIYIKQLRKSACYISLARLLSLLPSPEAQ